jgi:hypothetical protein
MRGSRTDWVVRWIERGLVIVGATCLLWAGAPALSAIVYQVEHKVSLERRDHFSIVRSRSRRSAASGSSHVVAERSPPGTVNIERDVNNCA